MGLDKPPADDTEKLKVLFLCTGNSARSIMAEFLLRRAARTRFEAFSAGANPAGRVNPFALRVLREMYKIDASGARCKSWDEFKETRMDFVITVCDDARETCPVFPGQPITAHWRSRDPAKCEGPDEEKFREFKLVAQQISRRVDLLVALPVEKLDRLRLAELAGAIGSKA